MTDRYRTYRRPKYKIAYKTATEMEWKCCNGYSGEDCSDGPNTQISSGRPSTSVAGSNNGNEAKSGEGITLLHLNFIQ